jgi:spore coat protein A
LATRTGSEPCKADVIRDIVMEEFMDEFGNITEMLLNGKHFMDPVTELPKLNDTEIWRWINTTEDVHPMHMHLVQFQVVDRQPFDVAAYAATGQIIFTGPPELPVLGEVGWMDTQNAPRATSRAPSPVSAGSATTSTTATSSPTKRTT